MSRLVACLLLSSLLLTGIALAQHRPPVGRALVARPFRGRYSRSAVPRDYFRRASRAHYRYAPSYHAYYHRRPYQTHIYYHRRPSGRAPVASLRSHMAGR